MSLTLNDVTLVGGIDTTQERRAPRGRFIDDLRRLRSDARLLKNTRSAARRQTRPAQWNLHRLLILVSLGVVPASFNISGGSINALLWITYSVVGVALLFCTPTSPRAWPWVAGFAGYFVVALISLAYVDRVTFGIQTLIQISVPAVIYVLAWRAPLRARLLRAMPVIAAASLVIASILLMVPPLGAVSVAVRPLAIGLAPLWVMATLNNTSVLYGLLTGALAVTAATVSGSRSASIVLLLLVITSPGVRLRWKGRTFLIALTLIGVLLYSQTTEFKQRYFFSQTASLSTIASNTNLLNTSGRTNIWPLLEEACSRHPIRGFGVGAAYGLSTTISDGAFSQPHNEFIRGYCDVGYAGSVPLWGYYLGLLGRSLWLTVRDPRRRRLHAAGLQVLIAVLFFAFTDNPLVYAGVLMTPVLLILGLSHSSGDRKPLKAPAPLSPSVGESA